MGKQWRRFFESKDGIKRCQVRLDLQFTAEEVEKLIEVYETKEFETGLCAQVEDAIGSLIGKEVTA